MSTFAVAGSVSLRAATSVRSLHRPALASRSTTWSDRTAHGWRVQVVANRVRGPGSLDGQPRSLLRISPASPALVRFTLQLMGVARGDGYGGAVVASSPEANTQQPTPPTPARLPSPMHRADERQRRGREGWRGRWTYRPRIEPFLHLHAPARYIRPADGLRSGATWLAPTCCQRTRASIPPEPCRPAS